MAVDKDRYYYRTSGDDGDTEQEEHDTEASGEAEEEEEESGPARSFELQIRFTDDENPDENDEYARRDLQEAIKEFLNDNFAFDDLEVDVTIKSTIGGKAAPKS